MSKYTYDEVVRVANDARAELRPGAIAWVIGVFAERPRGSHFSQFPPGVVYTIEYEDGQSVDIHEADIVSVPDRK